MNLVRGLGRDVAVTVYVRAKRYCEMTIINGSVDDWVRTTEKYAFNTICPACGHDQASVQHITSGKAGIIMRTCRLCGCMRYELPLYACENKKDK